MLRPILNHKVPVKIIKVKLSKDVKHFSVWHLLAFALVFAAIGGYIIWRSFALTTCACGEAASVPTSPTSLTTNPVSSSEIDFSWTASTSTVGIAGYNIYQAVSPDAGDGAPASDELIGQTSGPSATTFKLTGLDSDTTYEYYVAAKDSGGNLSTPSNGVTETTLADSQTSSLPALDTTATYSSTWPYSSPLGDKSCQKAQGGEIYNNCYCNSYSNYTDTNTTPNVRYKCLGSCVANNAGGDFVPLKGCRPTTTVSASCGIVGGLQPSWRASGIDQGVDFSIINYGASCNNNPNPGDIGDKSANARVYAAGNGVIKCVLPNSSNKQWCPDNPSPSSYNRPANSGTWLVYQLRNNNGKGDGLYVYVAEGCFLASNAVNDATASPSSSNGNSPGHRNLGRRWHVGDKVTANSVLCEIGNNGSYYNDNIETGWSSSSRLVYLADTPMWMAIRVSADGLTNRPGAGTPGSGGWVVYAATSWGYSFAEFMVQSGLPTLGIKPIHEFHNTSTGGVKQITGMVTVNGVGPAYRPKWYSVGKYPMPDKYRVKPIDGGWWNPNGL